MTDLNLYVDLVPHVDFSNIRMARPKNRLTRQVLIWIICTIILLYYNGRVNAETSLAIKVPVNPVAEGEILSLYCEVRGLQDGQSVEIWRRVPNNGVPGMKKLSVDESILGGVDDRFFLAYRRMPDGVSIYFLSITSVRREDTGEYYCKIDDIFNSELPIASVNLAVHFFPSADPICTQDGPLSPSSLSSDDSDYGMLACSSDVGNPPVQIQWHVYGEKSNDVEINANVVRVGRDGFLIQSSIRINERTSMAFQSKILTCSVTSTGYPGLVRTCNLGPLSFGHNTLTDIITSDKHQVISGKITIKPTTEESKVITDYSLKTKKDTNLVQFCRHRCSSFRNSKYPVWVITTAVAGILALVALLITLALYVRYVRRVDADAEEHRGRHHAAETVYTELDIQRNNVDQQQSSAYMSMTMAKKSNNENRY